MTALALLTGTLIIGCAGMPPTGIGVRDGRLASCPNKPNCVVSQGGDRPHHIEPIAYTGDKSMARNTLKQVIQGMPRTRIVTEEADYFHVEFKSRILGFVDDVEFYFPDTPIIHVRSASRMGYSDLGVNRKRIEKIRQLFQARTIG